MDTKKQNKGVLIGFLLFFLISLPVIAVFVSSRRQIGELRQFAAYPGQICTGTGFECTNGTLYQCEGGRYAVKGSCCTEGFLNRTGPCCGAGVEYGDYRKTDCTIDNRCGVANSTCNPQPSSTPTPAPVCPQGTSTAGSFCAPGTSQLDCGSDVDLWRTTHDPTCASTVRCCPVGGGGSSPTATPRPNSPTPTLPPGVTPTQPPNQTPVPTTPPVPTNTTGPVPTNTPRPPTNTPTRTPTPTTSQTSAVIGDFVWLDTDRDGLQDAGEVPVAGYEVVLVNIGTGVGRYTTVTDSNGYYEFRVPPGTYVIWQPTGGPYSFSPYDQGSDRAVDSNIRPNGQSAPIVVTGGTVNMTIDIGLYIAPTATPVIGQCLNVKIYKNDVVVTPSSLMPGDTIVVSIVAVNATQARIKINNETTWRTTTTKNTAGEWVFPAYTIPVGTLNMSINGQILVNTVWQ